MNVMVSLQRYTSTGESVRFSLGLDRMNFAGFGRYEPTDEFAEYEQYNISGWDGYDAAPISKETVSIARRFNKLLPVNVSRPDIAPGADGTIGFEWRFGPPENRTSVQIDVGPGDVIAARKLDQNANVDYLRKIKISGAENLIKQLFE
jgi:hypothetical protein